MFPRVRQTGDWVVAQTSLWSLFWTLGTFYRCVVVDPRSRMVTIRDRTAWFFPRDRTIAFKDVLNVGYGYRDQTISLSLFSGGEQSIDDRYTVGLKLIPDGKYVELFAFSGPGGRRHDGPFCNDLEAAFDISPVWTQAARSRQFAELLGKTLGRRITAV